MKNKKYQNLFLRIANRFHHENMFIYNFLFPLKNIECGHSLEPPRRGGSNDYPQSTFWAEIWKISEFFIWKFSVSGDEIFYIFE